MKDTHGGNIWQAAAEAGLDPAGIIDFSASINPYGPPTGVIEAIKDSLSVIPPYPDPDCVGVKLVLAEHHGISSDEVLAGNGSTEFIYLIPQVFKPKSALIIEPAFSEYKISLKLHGCGVETLVLREDEDFELDMPRLEREMRKGFRLLYIANPANPTGALIKKSRMFEVANLCETLGVTLVIDEAFMDFCEGGYPPVEESFKTHVKTFRNMLVLRSMTKFFAIAGLRLGYVIANKNIIKRISEFLPPWSVNSIASVAGCRALKDRAFMDDSRRRVKEEREAFSAALASTGAVMTYPSAANFLMAKITAQGLTAPVVKAELLKKGILVRDLSAVAGLGPRYLRFAVRKRDENALLADAIANIAASAASSSKGVLAGE